jgi:hypothetical protein
MVSSIVNERDGSPVDDLPIQGVNPLVDNDVDWVAAIRLFGLGGGEAYHACPSRAVTVMNQSHSRKQKRLVCDLERGVLYRSELAVRNLRRPGLDMLDSSHEDVKRHAERVA